MSIPIHLPHQQPSPIAVSTPLTTPNSLMTSTQVLALQTFPAACPTCSTHFLQPFAHYSIITSLFSSKPINPLALLTPWITTEMLSLANRRLERTYIASHYLLPQIASVCYHTLPYMYSRRQKVILLLNCTVLLI